MVGYSKTIVASGSMPQRSSASNNQSNNQVVSPIAAEGPPSRPQGAVSTPWGGVA